MRREGWGQWGRGRVSSRASFPGGRLNLYVLAPCACRHAAALLAAPHGSARLACVKNSRQGAFCPPYSSATSSGMAGVMWKSLNTIQLKRWGRLRGRWPVCVCGGG